MGFPRISSRGDFRTGHFPLAWKLIDAVSLANTVKPWRIAIRTSLNSFLSLLSQSFHRDPSIRSPNSISLALWSQHSPSSSSSSSLWFSSSCQRTSAHERDSTACSTINTPMDWASTNDWIVILKCQWMTTSQSTKAVFIMSHSMSTCTQVRRVDASPTCSSDFMWHPTIPVSESISYSLASCAAAYVAWKIDLRHHR